MPSPTPPPTPRTELARAQAGYERAYRRWLGGDVYTSYVLAWRRYLESQGGKVEHGPQEYEGY